MMSSKGRVGGGTLRESHGGMHGRWEEEGDVRIFCRI